MKIALIGNPSTRAQRPDFPPIGLAYLGAVAKETGHEVLLIDGGMIGIPKIVKEIHRFAPDVIGVTCWTIDRGAVWRLCRAIKEAVPLAFLVVGGPHATVFPHHVFKKTHASAVVLGEGEDTFRELLAALESKGDLSTVNGVALRNEDGSARLTGKREPIQDLDAIPTPFYRGFRDFSFRKYGGFPMLPRPSAAIVSSRGCVYDCNFCGSVTFWGRRWRCRSAENILDEINRLVAEEGVRSIYFFDDNLPVNKERITVLCEGLMRRNPGLQWSCCSHVKMINEDILALMKRSGCLSIDFGVESGSDRILKRTNKKQTRGDIERAFRLTHEAGILPRAYLMVGNPGESEETIDETIELITRIRPWRSIGATILWLLPGTSFYEEALRRGFLSEDLWLHSDDVPYNLQEHSYKELEALRDRLMLGIARKRGGILPILTYLLKRMYYRHPTLSFLRSLVPDILR